MNLADIRRGRGYTQENIAKLLGVGQSTVSMWETGEIIPRGRTLIKLAKLLDTSTDKILNSYAQQ